MSVFNIDFAPSFNFLSAQVPTLAPPEVQASGTWVMTFSFPEDTFGGARYTTFLYFTDTSGSVLRPFGTCSGT